MAEKGLSYTEHDVSVDKQARAEMLKLNPRGGVPTIVVDGAVVTGFDKARLEQLLQ